MRLAVLLSILAIPVFAEDAPTSNPTVIRPVVSILANAQADSQISLVGVVVARTETDLGFPVNGTIAARPVDVGDLIKKGDVIAQLDTEDLDADVRTAEAGITVATAQLRSAQNAADRASALSQRGTNSVTKLEDANRLLASAKARLEQAKASLARADDLRGFAVLRAPNDGVITAVYAQSSGVLTGGQPVVRLAEMEGREITIDVAEQNVAGLNTGALFDIELAADTRVTAQASLKRIDQVAASSTRTRRVHLTLIDPPAGFRLGALARVTADASEKTGISLDSSAILTVDGATSVWIVDRETNAVHLMPVTLGPRVGQSVRILDGLKKGDEVVIKGINSLKDGQIVGPSVHE
jgi:RND family efflux transporter MFP subunit